MVHGLTAVKDWCFHDDSRDCRTGVIIQVFSHLALTSSYLLPIMTDLWWGKGEQGRWQRGQHEPHLDGWAKEAGTGPALERRSGCVGHLIHRLRSWHTGVRQGPEGGVGGGVNAANGDLSWALLGSRALAGAPVVASALIGCGGGAGQSPGRDMRRLAGKHAHWRWWRAPRHRGGGSCRRALWDCLYGGGRDRR